MNTPKQLVKWAFKPMERAAALAAGEIQYFTGRACKKGHVANRLTSNGACVECSKEYQKARYNEDIEQSRVVGKQMYQQYRESKIQAVKNWRMNNFEKAMAAQKLWRENNKAKLATYENIRRANKHTATPSWLSQSDLEKISKYYETSSFLMEMTGQQFAVDHIVPLKGENVCGLNVPWNLRITSRSYNSHKKNNLDDGIDFTPSLDGGILIHSSALPWNWS